MQLSDNLLKLSPREIQIVQLVSDGEISKQIAGRLGLSRRTVEAHMRNICKKIGATNQAQMISICMRSGIIA